MSTGIIASKEVSDDLIATHQKDEAFINFTKQQLQSEEVDLNKPLKKMKLKTFADMSKAKAAKVKGKEVSLKNDRELLARLVVIE